MKWFDRWFYRKTRWCWHRAESEYPELKHEQDYQDELAVPVDDELGLSLGGLPMSNRLAHNRSKRRIVPTENDSLSLRWPLTVKLRKVNSGFVVQFQHFNLDTDEYHENIYLITDQQDFNKELSHLITLESLRG